MSPPRLPPWNPPRFPSVAARPFGPEPLIRPPADRAQQGFQRFTYRAADFTADVSAAGEVIVRTTLKASGAGLVYPRAENNPSEDLWIWVGSVAANSAGKMPPPTAKLKPGGIFPYPWIGGALTIGRRMWGSTLLVSSDVVVWVVDGAHVPETGFDPQHLEPQAGYLEADINAPGKNAWQLANPGGRVNGINGVELWTDPPQAVASGWRIDRLDRVSFAVLDDATLANSIGTTLRPWWFFPNLFPDTGAVNLRALEFATATNGWVPDPTTYVVAAGARMFTLQINVRPGTAPGGNLLAQLGIFSTQPRLLAGALLTFQASNIPAGSGPYLIVCAEALQ